MADNYKERLQVWYDHPEIFCEEVFNEKLTTNQRYILKEMAVNNKISVKSCNSSGKCMSVDDLVTLSDGSICKAGELVGQSFDILSYDDKSKEQVSKQAFAQDNGVKPCLKIKTNSGVEITRTTNHPLYMANRVITHKANYIDGRRITRVVTPIGWTNCEDLKVGDLILVPEKTESFKEDSNISDNEAKLIGYLLGDGGTTIKVLFTQEDNEQLKEFKEICKSLDCECTQLKHDKNTYYVAHKTHIKGNRENKVLALARAWGFIGVKSKDKKIPNFVFSLPKKQKALVLNRLFACDGWAYVGKAQKNNKGTLSNICISLASKEMIDGIYSLLLSFGIRPSIRHRTVKYDDSGKTFDAWEIAIQKRQHIEIFYNEIGIFGKEDALSRVYQASQERSRDREVKWHTYHAPDGFIWEEIKSIADVGEQPTVAISVEDTHTYITQVYDHNTYLFSMVIPWFFFTRLALYPEKSCIVVFTAPVFSQMQTGILGGVKHNIKKAGKILSKRYNREITLFDNNPSEDVNNAKFFFDDRSFIIGLASKSANEIAGKHANNVMVLFDEAQGLKDDIYSGFAGIMSSGKVTEVLIGNTTLPNGCSGKFYDSFDENSEYKQITITSFDTPNFVLPNIKVEDYTRDETDPDFWRNKLDKFCGTNYAEAKLKNKIGLWEHAVIDKLPVDGLANPIGVNSIMQKAGYNIEDYEVKTRVLAEFPDSTGASTYPLTWIQNSKDKWLDPNEHIIGKKILGIDFGRGVGKDKSSFAFVNGNKGEWIKSYDLDTLEVLAKVDEIYHDVRFDHIQVENNGEGIHFARLLREKGYKVYEIDAGSSPGFGKTKDFELRKQTEDLKKIYHLKRDEEWWTLREKICPNRLEGDPIFLIPPYPELERQMRASTYSLNAKNQIVVATKKELYKRLKKSTDELDSLLVAIATVEEDDEVFINNISGNLYTYNLKMDNTADDEED